MDTPPVYDTINLSKISESPNNGSLNPNFNEGDQPLDIYSQAPSIIVSNSMMNANNRSNNQLNTSSISFDLLNTNANNLKTRYDVKSLTNSSLYGSKTALPPLISIDTNGSNKNNKKLSQIQ